MSAARLPNGLTAGTIICVIYIIYILPHCLEEAALAISMWIGPIGPTIKRKHGSKVAQGFAVDRMVNARNGIGRSIRNVGVVKTILDIGVFAVTVILMLTVGTELHFQQFKELARGRKWFLILLLVVPVIVLPIVGYFVIRILSLPENLAAGILLVAACPVGDISNFYVLLGRGNLPVTVTTNVVSCLLSAITMGLVFWVYNRILLTPFQFSVPPESLILRISLMAALPVAAGISLRRFVPGLVKRIGNLLWITSFFGVGFILIYTFVRQWEHLVAEWQQTTLASAVFMCIAMLGGLLFSAILRLEARDAFTTGVLFSVRNVGLAMAIAVTLLDRVEYAVFAAVYFLVEAPVQLSAVAIYRRWMRRNPAWVSAINMEVNK